MLAKSNKNLEKLKIQSKNEKWSKKIVNRGQLENFYRISKNISLKNFKRKILATKYKNFRPYIIFKNKKFELKD